jgi:hypothetical protein
MCRKSRALLPIVPLAILLVALAPTRATAQCVSGSGESLEELAPLPQDSPLRKDPDFERTFPSGFDHVGYKYSYGHVFFIPVWTSGGQYVLYSGDRYVKIGTDAGPVSKATGISEDKLAKPFFYRVPPGWLALPLVVIVLFFLASRRWRPSKEPPPGKGQSSPPRRPGAPP